MKIMVKFFEQDKCIFASYKKTPYGKEMYTDNSTKLVQANFDKLVKKIRQTPIRLAMLGGLHRCGSTAHLLGNYIIQNTTPQKTKTVLYEFERECGLTTVLAVNFILPKKKIIGNKFYSTLYYSTLYAVQSDCSKQKIGILHSNNKITDVQYFVLNYRQNY